MRRQRFVFLSQVQPQSLPFGKVSLAGLASSPDGWLRAVPLNGANILERREVAQGRVHTAVDHAVQLGASIVGLGRLAAHATRGGETLRPRKDVGVTNGKALTAGMTLRQLQRLLSDCSARDPLVAVVGATSGVGCCLTRLMTQMRSMPRLLLVGRARGNLHALREELRAGHVGLQIELAMELEAVQRADVVVVLTGAMDVALCSAHLKPGALVLDVSAALNTARSLRELRPDVSFFDGGLVSLPGVQLACDLGLAAGLVPACLAETMLLSLVGHRGHFSIGDPTPWQAAYALDLADEYAHLGFGLSALRSTRARGEQGLLTGSEAAACQHRLT